MISNVDPALCNISCFLFQIIAEAQRILYSRESLTDAGKGKKANCIARTTIEMNGILVKKVNNNNSYVC